MGPRGKLAGASIALVAALVVSPVHPAAAAVTCAEEHDGETLAGPVIVPAGAECLLLNSVVSGSVSVGQGGLVVVQGTTVTGSVTTTGGALQILASSIGGNVQAIRPVEFNIAGGAFIRFVVCESTVKGAVLVSGGQAGAVGDAILIGDSTLPSCDGSNRIRGNVTSSNNSVVSLLGHSIENNVVGGSLTCLNNTPAPTIAANTVTGATVGQCNVP